MNVKMILSEKGLMHLVKIEGGAQLSLYDDLGKGKGHCTIGVGHLVNKEIYNGVITSEKPYLKGIALKKAYSILKNDLIRAEASVNGKVTVPLTQNQYDALVSFVFNIGGGSFSDSTILKLINQKRFIDASNEFSIWNKATVLNKKIIVSGLINKRIAEKMLFLKK